jgi:hypothetical protein
MLLTCRSCNLTIDLALTLPCSEIREKPEPANLQ